MKLTTNASTDSHVVSCIPSERKLAATCFTGKYFFAPGIFLLFRLPPPTLEQAALNSAALRWRVIN